MGGGPPLTNCMVIVFVWAPHRMFPAQADVRAKCGAQGGEPDKREHGSRESYFTKNPLIK